LHELSDIDRDASPTDVRRPLRAGCVQVDDPLAFYFMGIDNVDTTVTVPVEHLSPHVLVAPASLMICWIQICRPVCDRLSLQRFTGIGEYAVRKIEALADCEAVRPANARCVWDHPHRVAERVGGNPVHEVGPAVACQVQKLGPCPSLRWDDTFRRHAT